MQRVLIILPAYNEAENIERVVTQIRNVIPTADILVISDGSTDGTFEKAQAVGAFALRLPYNVGIGSAVQTGFKFAALHDYEIVVRNDGDGQHDPKSIHCLIDTLQEKDVDVVIGSRFIGDEEGDYGTSFFRRAGIFYMTRLIRLLTGQTVTDPTSGFCAFNAKAIHLFAHSYPHDYPEPEAIVILSRAGLKLCEIPVTMLKREFGKSSITPIRSIYYMIKVSLAMFVSSTRYS